MDVADDRHAVDAAVVPQLLLEDEGFPVDIVSCKAPAWEI